MTPLAPVAGYRNQRLPARQSFFWLAWALSVGGPLLWRANYPKVPDKESPSMADRYATV